MACLFVGQNSAPKDYRFYNYPSCNLFADAAMRNLTLCLSLLLCCLSRPIFAQTGCVIVYGVNASDTRVYTTSLGTFTTCNGQTVENYSNLTYVTLGTNCQWSPNPAASPGTLRNCIVNGTSCGVKATYTQICNVPIDHYIWLALLFAIGLSYYSLIKPTRIKS